MLGSQPFGCLGQLGCLESAGPAVAISSVRGQPGDVGWVSQKGWQDALIRWAQHRKYGDSPAASFNHVFLVTGPDEVIQANASGVAVGKLSAYGPADQLTLRHPPYGELGANLTAVSAARELLGTKYGYWTIACEAISLLTGTRLRFGLEGTEICSGLVAYALTRANIDLGEDELFSTPADIFATAIQQAWATA